MKPYYERDGITIYHGDCREILPGLTAEMAFTDPPYGVTYEGGHFHSGNVNIVRKRERLANDGNANIYREAVPLIFASVRGPVYLWCAGTKLHDVYGAILSARGEIHALLVWEKVNATYAAMNSQYKQRTEYCVYCKPRGATLRWCGPSNECTLWRHKRDPKNIYHPTQKPVSLAERALRNHTATSVLDPFMGAGSTLIAAQALGRLATGVEVEEKYCEIAARRLDQQVLALESA